MKTALITGASRGIGEATAYQLAKEYDCVAIMSRNTDGKLNAVANQIHTTTNCECIPFTGDVSDFAFVEECVRSLAASGHPVDTLVNNAGISLVGLFQDMTPEEFDRILRINVTSVYNTCHAVIPDMVRNQRGRILNISSVWGLVGASCEVAYSATKGAINSLTMALAKELADRLELPFYDCLKVVGEGAPQHTLPSASRSGNVRGMYDVEDESILKDKTVLLADDIKTSGATLDECALMLRLNGAKAVYALCACVAKEEYPRKEERK